jgi:hypothetical protein
MASLAPKTDVLGYHKAAHLLRRATYRITKSMINAYALKTPQQALDDLFVFTSPNPPTPLDTVNKTYIPTIAYPVVTGTDFQTNSNTQRMRYYGWYGYHSLTNPTLQYKLINWLHTLFITSAQDTMHWMVFDYLELLRFHTNGSLKELAVRMTRNTRMLWYLNNRNNTKFSPDQNYAREFLELFTILKGEQIGTGNYTTYTEHDVQQAARVMTGFTVAFNGDNDRTIRLNNVDPVTQIPMGTINTATHDTGNKTFSAAFQNTTIQGGATATAIQQELVDFVAMVFNQTATAKSYCRRLYRFFVSRNITPEVETDIITPLAATMMANNYNIMPVVKQLLCSKHFYDEDDNIVGDKIIGALIKSPVDLIYQMYSIFQIALPNPLTNSNSIQNAIGSRLAGNMNTMGVDWLRPLDVNGYPAYSSDPHYDKNWITTATLRSRYLNTIDSLITGFTNNGHLYKLVTATFVKNSGHFTNPANSDVLLQEFYDLLFSSTPQGNRHIYFKDALLGGLSTINWQMDWNNYVTTNNAASVTVALNRLVNAMIKSPEYQVM